MWWNPPSAKGWIDKTLPMTCVQDYRYKCWFKIIILQLNFFLKKILIVHLLPFPDINVSSPTATELALDQLNSCLSISSLFPGAWLSSCYLLTFLKACIVLGQFSFHLWVSSCSNLGMCHSMCISALNWALFLSAIDAHVSSAHFDICLWFSGLGKTRGWL